MGRGVCQLDSRAISLDALSSGDDAVMALSADTVAPIPCTPVHSPDRQSCNLHTPGQRLHCQGCACLCPYTARAWTQLCHVGAPYAVCITWKMYHCTLIISNCVMQCCDRQTSACHSCQQWSFVPHLHALRTCRRTGSQPLAVPCMRVQCVLGQFDTERAPSHMQRSLYALDACTRVTRVCWKS